MTQLNFKKMYLISCEKYDILNTLSMQNTNNRSIPTPMENSYNIDSQNIITHARQNTNEKKRKILNSNNEGVGDEEEVSAKKAKCPKICYERTNKCPPTNDMVDGNKRYINSKSNIYKTDNFTQSDISNNVKTKPHFRKTFARTFKSTKGSLQKTRFNKNGKRGLETDNIDSPEDFHTPGSKRNKYTSEISDYSLHNIPSPKRRIDSASMSKKLNTTINLIPQRKYKKKQNLYRWLKLI